MCSPWQPLLSIYDQAGIKKNFRDGELGQVSGPGGQSRVETFKERELALDGVIKEDTSAYPIQWYHYTTRNRPLTLVDI